MHTGSPSSGTPRLDVPDGLPRQLRGPSDTAAPTALVGTGAAASTARSAAHGLAVGALDRVPGQIAAARASDLRSDAVGGEGREGREGGKCVNMVVGSKGQ